MASLAAVLLVAAPHSCAAGESVRMMEQSIKAGLLYNFLKYTEWPESQDKTVSVVCLFGRRDPFRGSLAPMAERTVNQRKITLQQIDAIDETGACDIVFVGADEKPRWPELAAFLTGKSILTMSDYPGFAHDGGMVELGEKDSRIDVGINMEAVSAARLVVQDRLLALAHVVPATGR